MLVYCWAMLGKEDENILANRVGGLEVGTKDIYFDQMKLEAIWDKNWT